MDEQGSSGNRAIKAAYRDPLVVPTAALAEALKPWVKRHNTDHPSYNGQNLKGKKRDELEAVAYEPTTKWPSPINGIRYLSEKSGLHYDTVYSILENPRKRAKFTPLAVADDLLSAAGLTHLLHDGDPPTIPLVPNPKWSNERWQAWREEHGNC